MIKGIVLDKAVLIGIRASPVDVSLAEPIPKDVLYGRGRNVLTVPTRIPKPTSDANHENF